MKVEGPHPLREIFSYNSTTRYITLPVYQRNFDWAKKHFIDFLEDLEKTTQTWKTDSEPWFFGDIYNEGQSPTTGKLTIIDGQQRLATCYLTIICARDFFYARDGENNKKGIALVDDNMNWLDGYLYHYDTTTKQPNKNSPLVELGKVNRGFFNTYVLPAKKPSEKLQQMNDHYPNDSCKNLCKAYEIISKNFESKAHADIKILIDTLLEAFTVVRISVPDQITAAKLFEALNHRGTGKLKDPDLSKYYIFTRLRETLEKTTSSTTTDRKKAIESKIDEYDDRWADIRNKIEGTNEANYDMVSFLYNYVVNFIDPNASSSTIVDVLRNFLDPTAKAVAGITKKTPMGLIDDIIIWSEIFGHLRDPTSGNFFDARNYPRLNFYLKKLLVVEPKHAYTPIIAGYQNLWENGKKKEFENLVQVIFRYHVRNKTIGTAKAGDIEPKMKEVMVNITKNKSLDEIIDDLTKNKDIHKPNKVIEAELEDYPWTRNVPLLYYVLEEFEGNYAATPIDITHEHIMTHSSNKNWINYIMQKRNCTEDAAKQFQEKWRNRIGNLTLLGDKKNKQAGTRLFADKIPFYKQDYYKITSNLDTLYSNTDWTETELTKRHDDLKNQLLVILDIEKLKTKP